LREGLGRFSDITPTNISSRSILFLLNRVEEAGAIFGCSVGELKLTIIVNSEVKRLDGLRSG
jgi:hypothetical protein